MEGGRVNAIHPCMRCPACHSRESGPPCKTLNIVWLGGCGVYYMWSYHWHMLERMICTILHRDDGPYWIRGSTIVSRHIMCSASVDITRDVIVIAIRNSRLSINESIFSFKAAILVYVFPVLALMDLGALLQAFSAKTSATSQKKLT